MQTYATKAFELDARDADGVSLRATLEGLLKRARTAERKAELEAQLALPEFPVELAYLWSTFVRIRSRQGADAMGNPKPITWRELEAFMAVTRSPHRPWEADLLMDLDEAWLSAVQGARNAE